MAIFPFPTFLKFCSFFKTQVKCCLLFGAYSISPSWDLNPSPFAFAPLMASKLQHMQCVVIVSSPVYI